MDDKFTVLRNYFGYPSFRKGQEDMVDCLLSGRDALGIMPTGAGKSICYQVPAIMMSGVTVVVSPLISLMKDQVNSLIQQGISSAYINSSLTLQQLTRVLQNASNGKYKIIYVAPERLLTSGFLNLCSKIDISMVAIDEAHCVSQWGQDFRPSYLNINDFITYLPKRPVVGAFTATATDEVKEDIVKILKLENPKTVTTGFDRPNLFFSVLRPDKKGDKLLELIAQRKGKSGIVYCNTRKRVEKVCALLNENGFSATRYHAGLTDEERRKNQDDFVFDRKTIMVATNAFGMGIDKSNVSFVIHFNMPKNIESYYQEAGRAGRDGSEADCILLYGKSDVSMNRFFIENTEPNPQLTDEQNEFIRKREEERLKYMTFYCTASDCLRGRILKYFGDSHEEKCGKCSNCLAKFETQDVTVEAQKILSCIVRTGQSYGANMIIEVLRGESNEKLINAGLNVQSTYGIMKQNEPAEIKYIIEELEEMGYISLIGDKYPTLKITETSYPILRGKTRVFIKKMKEVKTITQKQNDLYFDEALMTKLKELRTALAKKKSVPAYVIFTDAALTEMCKKLPVTDEEFLAISGVGRNKLEKYGQAFMDEINDYLKSH